MRQVLCRSLFTQIWVSFERPVVILPLKILIRVVFPAPDGPISPVTQGWVVGMGCMARLDSTRVEPRVCLLGSSAPRVTRGNAQHSQTSWAPDSSHSRKQYKKASDSRQCSDPLINTTCLRLNWVQSMIWRAVHSSHKADNVGNYSGESVKQEVIGCPVGNSGHSADLLLHRRLHRYVSHCEPWWPPKHVSVFVATTAPAPSSTEQLLAIKCIAEDPKKLSIPRAVLTPNKVVSENCRVIPDEDNTGHGSEIVCQWLAFTDIYIWLTATLSSPFNCHCLAKAFNWITADGSRTCWPS